MNAYAVVYMTAAEWAALTPPDGYLKGDATAGQEGIESDTGLRKQGPGYWGDLDYLPTPALLDDLDAGGHKITGLANGTAPTDAAAFGQIPDSLSDLGPATADLPIGGHKLTGVTAGTASGHAVEFDQLATAIAALVNSAPGILDTLGEIATALQADESTAAALATTVAGKLAKASNLSDLVSAATARTNLGVAIGTDVEAHDADLTTIAALAPTNDDLLQRKAGGWTNRTPAQVRTDLGAAAPDIQVFAASGTWNKPAGAKLCLVGVTAPGGGGGSGRRGASAAVRGAGSGGGGGQRVWAMLDASVLGSTETVTINAVGNGGATQTTNATDGNPGTDGGTALFGAWLTALGGKGGLGGTNTGGTSGGAAQFPGGTAGANAGISGAAGASADGATGKGTLNAAGGGGGGGGITAAGVESAGGNGGGNVTTPTGVSGGAVRTNGNPGTSSPTGDYVPGGGGSGGGSGDAAGTIAGGTGGVGGTPGGGGGGGGGSTNGANSGVGGAGGPGRVLVVTYF